MASTYGELAELLGTKAVELANFASQNLKDSSGNLFPPGIKAALTDEQVDLILIEFPKYKAPAAESELKQLPQADSGAIQEVEKSEIPASASDSQAKSDSYLEQARLNLEKAKAAQNQQAVEVLEQEIREIQERGTQLGIFKAVVEDAAEIKGYVLGKNAIAQSRQSNDAELFGQKIQMLLKGTDFLPPPEKPTPLDSIASDNSDQLKKLSGN